MLIFILYDECASYIWAGNIFGVVDLYFISRARVMCGREILLERLIYILYHEREIYMGGNIVEAVEDLKMHFYRAAVLIYGRGIFLGC